MHGTTLKTWFQDQSRDLPWRNNPSPYAVWVSEVMLQQTQVSVVIPYFLHWMQLFPSIQALADASLEEVIKAWEGLGYYSRARHLHQGAKEVVSLYGGILPDTADALTKIKGLGPYTVGAILSFAFHRRAIAVDGNVIRVLTRFRGIYDDISKPKTIHRVREEAEKLLPDTEPWIFNEALIELGATVCKKVPDCGRCPLSRECVAYREGTQKSLPIKTKKIQYVKLARTVAVIRSKRGILLRQGLKGEIMQDLYEFPYFEEVLDVQNLQLRISQWLGVSVTVPLALKPVAHAFTKHRVRLVPYYCEITEECGSYPGYVWIPLEKLQAVSFSSGHKRVLQEVNSASFKYL